MGTQAYFQGGDILRTDDGRQFPPAVLKSTPAHGGHIAAVRGIGLGRHGDFGYQPVALLQDAADVVGQGIAAAADVVRSQKIRIGLAGLADFPQTAVHCRRMPVESRRQCGE